MSTDNELNDILDKCLEQMLAEGATVEECLAGYPDHASDLEPLLVTAFSASQALDSQPDDEVRERSRYRFRLEMARADAPRRQPFFRLPPGWRQHPRWAMVVAVVVVVALAGGGTVFAADSSMPGNPLYGIKLATERLRVALARSDIDRAELYARWADRRVTELRHVVNKGDARLVALAADRYDRHLKTMDRLSLDAPAPAKESPETDEQPALSTEALKDEVLPKDLLTAREPTTPRLAPADLEARLRAVRALPGNQRMKLRVVMGYYVVTHPAELRDMLEKAPESARPAIRRLIQESVMSYRIWLQQLSEHLSGADGPDGPSREDSSPRAPDSSTSDGTSVK